MSVEVDTSGWALWRETRYTETVGGALPPSPEEELRNDGSRAIRTLFVLWEEREQAYRDILGYAEIKRSAMNGNRLFISRTTPMPFKDLSNRGNLPFMYAAQVLRTEGWGVNDDFAGDMRNHITDTSAYLLAKMTVLFEAPTYRIFEDSVVQEDESRLERYVTRQSQVSGRTFAVPTPDALKFVDGAATPVASYPQKVEVTEDIIIRHYHVPFEAIPNPRVNPLCTTDVFGTRTGKVNSAEFLDSSAGTILYLGASCTPTSDHWNARTYLVEHRFQFFAPGHNFIWNKGTFTYTEVSRTGATNLVNKANGVSLYDWADMADLFRPPQ